MSKTTYLSALSTMNALSPNNLVHSFLKLNIPLSQYTQLNNVICCRRYYMKVHTRLSIHSECLQLQLDSIS